VQRSLIDDIPLLLTKMRVGHGRILLMVTLYSNLTLSELLPCLHGSAGGAPELSLNLFLKFGNGFLASAYTMNERFFPGTNQVEEQP